MLLIDGLFKSLSIAMEAGAFEFLHYIIRADKLHEVLHLGPYPIVKIRSLKELLVYSLTSK